uniref:Uncharacterized protein n=1 Tax=Avena sativa TaxID=4498 RepID=A0ACD5TFA0_AVESA
MGEMVASAVVQEAVSGAVSFMLSNREEKASKKRRMERLEMAHLELEFALERSKRMPITDRSLLCRMQMIEHAYEECGEALQKHKVRIVENEESGPQTQGVITHQSSSFLLPKKVLGAIKSYASYFFTPNKDVDVGRFEWFADKASKLVRDVEVQPGCSLARRSFFTSILSELLQGKTLSYRLLQGSKTYRLSIEPFHSQDNGVLALLYFCREDPDAPTDCFDVELLLRLSESTDIVGITIKCLQSLGPQFEPLASDATTGELTRLLAQDVFYTRPSLCRTLMSGLNVLTKPKPLPHDHILIPHFSKLSTALDSSSHRFPEQVISVYVESYVSTESSTSSNQPDINVVNDWPLLQMSALFLPHDLLRLRLLQKKLSVEMIGEQKKFIDTHLDEREEMVLTRGIDCFIHQPEVSVYKMSWTSGQGSALFTVAKMDSYTPGPFEVEFMSVIPAVLFKESILSSTVESMQALADMLSQPRQQRALTL